MLTVQTLPVPQTLGRKMAIQPDPTLGSAVDIRLQISEWVATGQMEDADTLSKCALAQRPDNEELLVARALVCEVMHKWPEASECIRHLLHIQGNKAPATVWQHYVRVLQCQGLKQQALTACRDALCWHPQNADLLMEQHALLQMPAPISPASA